MYMDGFFSSLAERKPFRAEARVRRADGEWRWVESLGAPRFSQSGEFLGMVGSSPDVTERKNAEEELHRYREHLEELVANRTRDLRELAHRLVDTQEKERARVGNELHDEIGQILTYTTLLIDRSVRKQDHTALPEAKTAIQEAIARVRNLSSVLSPFLLRSAGLMPALVSLTGEYVRRTNIKIDFDQNGNMEGVAEDVALATYRIVQEALTNVARHANASEIYLRLAREPGRLRLEIADNGNGFDPGAVKKSTGLAGMRERAMALGGVLSIEPNGRQGTRIVADLPLPD
jgi:signal transduction histidine kinase